MMAGRILWLALALAVVVFVGASSPSIAQRAPRVLFPTLAAAGAVLLVLSLVSSLVQLVRRYRGEGRVLLVPVVVIGVATTFLVVLPATHLVRALTVSRDGAPRIHTEFGAWRGAEGYPLLAPHRGIDVAGRIGDDVLAAADGRVTVAQPRFVRPDRRHRP